MANLVFARSNDVNLDCVKIFEDLRNVENIGNGGGKSNFVNAKIVRSRSDKVVEALINKSLESI
jgi:hypothetical protein